MPRTISQLATQGISKQQESQATGHCSNRMPSICTLGYSNCCVLEKMKRTRTNKVVNKFKGIVQPKKRGVEPLRHPIQLEMFLGTLKGLHTCFKSQKNNFQHLGSKKHGVLLYVTELPNTVVMLRYFYW
jgi:hypothetical protein